MFLLPKILSPHMDNVRSKNQRPVEVTYLLQYAPQHRWELLGNYPDFTVVMVIFHYVERIWRVLVTPNYLYNINDHA